MKSTAGITESAERFEGKRLDAVTRAIIGAAIEVHKQLGPGLLESAYQTCLAFELRERGLQVREQVALPVVYKDVRLDCGYRLDLMVEGSVIVEIKAVEHLLPIHEAQLLSHLRLAKKEVGLLMNFHSAVLKDGVKRLVNGFADSATLAALAVGN